MSAGATPTRPGSVSQVNGPNVLTGIRILLVPVFAVMLLIHPSDPAWRQATTVVFVIAILTDFVDGWWARRANLVTDFGKIADPIADKALTGMAFIGLSVLGELPWWVTILVLVREWGITVMRFVLLRRGVVLAANKGGKFKTTIQAIALVMYLLPLPGYLWGQPITSAVVPEIVSWILMAVAVIVTVFTGIDYVREQVAGPRGDDD
ncbi:CDP-diacylglycerol--glycerol-3-phosphate 3-phosphatidyltransferase [Enemella dayhoffiae]|uniref:CDP-diacylglycerol--glycerol-3-phosphate 3-phosphatidyltransferase n=1 Tax=Enemella dayhoffiae TaxID=2016507 RepID=A0A255H618_9ACTN|nr:CDP-diacylglycerol--glycerol-3-phosphate 3-phosphatidyltransferase [Enemella dayhoffiae]OYO22054.1 CDP-diacylglycerol--glycerol-3-phosphate 3-phosphatidyltransferase [Enemella dayhoffiae]